MQNNIEISFWFIQIFLDACINEINKYFIIQRLGTLQLGAQGNFSVLPLYRSRNPDCI